MSHTSYNRFPADVRVPLCPAPIGGRWSEVSPGRMRDMLGGHLRVDPDRVFLVNSGTAALCLAFAALQPASDGEVLVSTFVCPSVVQAIRTCGLTPQFVDVAGPARFVPSLPAMLSRVSSRTVAVLAADVLGHYSPTPELAEALRSARVAVIDDAAQSFGSSPNGRITGTSGTFGILSFGRHKPLSIGAGGALIVNDARFVSATRRVFAGLPLAAPHPLPAPWFDEVPDGIRSVLNRPVEPARMRDLGLQQLDDALGVWEVTAKRATALGMEIVHCLDSRYLRNSYRLDQGWVPSFLVVEVAAQSRTHLAQALAVRGVETTWLYFPMHRVLAGRHEWKAFPVADELWKRTLCLPCRGQLTASHVRRLVGAVEAVQAEVASGGRTP